MRLRKGLVGVAAAALVFGSTAWADSSMPRSSPDNSGASAAVDSALFSYQPVMADSVQPAAPAAPDRAPLMAGLDKVGAGQWLDKAHLNIYGYVETGYLYDTTVPHNLTPPKSTPGNLIQFPGDYKNQFMLNQVDLSIERKVDASKEQFDVGFKIEGIYGRDAFYTHSNGVLDSTNKHGGVGDGENQLDLEQAYLTFAIPVGSGLTIQAGKFASLMGFEYINPTQNIFYTHSYEFSFGIPFTQTGILASYSPTDKLSVTAGFTRGWNQTLYDNNGAIDFLGQVIYTATDKLTLTGNVSIGPQSTLPYGPGDNGHYWLVPEAIGTYNVSDQLSVDADMLYGLANSYATWFGVAGYADYKFNKYLAANGRIEFYHDGRHFTTGVATPSDVNYWEFTLGGAVTPLPDNVWFNSLTIRPEIRLDLADNGVFDGSKFSELNFAIDAYWKF